MTVGKPPPGSRLRTPVGAVTAQWTVVADPTAKGRACHRANQHRHHGLPLSARHSMPAGRRRTSRAEIRFKAVGGKVDRAGGIAVRVEDPDNYYIARANALEDNVRFYRVVAGRRAATRLAPTFDVTSGEWHTLALEAQGRALRRHLSTAPRLFEVNRRHLCRGRRRCAVDQGRQRDALRRDGDHAATVRQGVRGGTAACHRRACDATRPTAVWWLQRKTTPPAGTSPRAPWPRRRGSAGRRCRRAAHRAAAPDRALRTSGPRWSTMRCEKWIGRSSRGCSRPAAASSSASACSVAW